MWGMDDRIQCFYEWLSDFNEVNFGEDEGGLVGWLKSTVEEDWYSQEEFHNNSYMITGYQGKTSLVYHLASSLGYKVIEVNNADQAIANIVPSVQEATQSRVIKSSSFPLKKSKNSSERVFTKCPIILIDDLDINIPAAFPFIPSVDSVPLTNRTSFDLYSQSFEKVFVCLRCNLVVSDQTRICKISQAAHSEFKVSDCDYNVLSFCTVDFEDLL